MAAQVDRGLARHRGQRQRDQRAEHAVDLGAEKQGEDDQQRVDAQRAAEDLRRDDVVINLVEVVKENWSFGGGIAQYAE